MSDEELRVLSLKYHAFYRGKIQIGIKCPVRSLRDFSIWYTPGVAEPCREIEKNRELVYEYTSKENLVAIVTDGSRVLGLGDIGPEAGLPVMEGKALLFKYLGGVDAIPLALRVRDADEFIRVVESLEPSFGGVNLEDIAKPKCFYILERLRDSLEIPVWHDDQQGTATVITAGMINALKLVGKKPGEVVVAMIGAGAASLAVARLLFAAGIDPAKTRMVDSRGVLHAQRGDLEEIRRRNPWKYEMALKTNAEGVSGGIAEAMRGADAVIALSTPGPGVIRKEWVRLMQDNPIVFACANPVPEIWPWEAKEAGARVVATGRSDFPNQANNALVFPGVFRGALDVRAKTITDEMCLAAAMEIARMAEEKGLGEDHIIPSMEDWEVFPREAAAVGSKAIEQGIARVRRSWKQLYEDALETIRKARETLSTLMREGLIPPPPE